MSIAKLVLILDLIALIDSRTCSLIFSSLLWWRWCWKPHLWKNLNVILEWQKDIQSCIYSLKKIKGSPFLIICFLTSHALVLLRIIREESGFYSRDDIPRLENVSWFQLFYPKAVLELYNILCSPCVGRTTLCLYMCSVTSGRTVVLVIFCTSLVCHRSYIMWN